MPTVDLTRVILSSPRLGTTWVPRRPCSVLYKGDNAVRSKTRFDRKKVAIMLQASFLRQKQYVVRQLWRVLLMSQQLLNMQRRASAIDF